MEGMSRLAEKIEAMFARMPTAPEPHYDCDWCRDSGWVTCYKEHGQNYPMKAAWASVYERVARGNPIVGCPCGFCEAGTYRGRATEGSLRGAERWVKENVTGIVSLAGTHEKAESEGFDRHVVDQAIKRLGIRKFKHAGRWMCDPMAQ